MKKIHSPLVLIVILLIGCSIKQTVPDTNFTQYVNPFVGTDFHGHTYPGALVPFGMIQPSPDTRLDGWDGCSGYHYSDDFVYGFSHTHLSGTGCLDYGDVLLMPFMKQASVINTEYGSKFSHDNEVAQPGYYAVTLDKNNVKVELTATPRVAVHRYTFPESSETKGIILDLKHRDLVLESAIMYHEDEGRLDGYRNSKSWSDNQKLHFSILFSQPVKSIEYYVDDQLVPDMGMGIEGKNCKAVVYFEDNTKDIVLKVAISGDILQAAEKNLVEVPDFNFDRVRGEADSIWNKELGKIVVETEDIEKKRVFYTALYHCFTAPYLFTNIDGTYWGQDGNIHKATEGREVYTVFSLWDTYRALHPLLSLIDRKRTEDFLYTFMRHYEQGEQLPVWELAGHETWCMIGYHSVPVILDAYRKGLISDDPNEMLEAMVHSAKLNKLGRPEYAKYGYIPADMEHEDVSKTLEYAYDDWVIAQFAKEIGNEEVYEEFIERSQYYKNLLDFNGFMHSKINGGFEKPFNPAEVNNRFTEGNSWQYSTYVPHDLATYIELLGGRDVAERHFDSLFHTTAPLAGRDQVDVTGLIGQYAHGNEPSHHAAYLYNYVGSPWKTQELTRQIMREFYTSKPDGLCGNEDCGQMSAWYVLSSMGFYPVCPGDNQYAIGSPIFDKVTIHLGNGKQFVITSKNQSDKNIYITSAKLNGKKLKKSYLTYSDIKNGAKLDFVMNDQPNKTLWSDDTAFPPSKVEDNLITMVPIVSPSGKIFREQLDIELLLYQPAVKGNATMPYPAQTDMIYYTLDGSEPTKEATQYSKPITITENTVLKAVSWNEKTGYSKVVESEFTKFEKDRFIKILTEYSPAYTAGGDDGLIDNVRGKSNFSLGGWQGYWGTDFEAIVDLGEVKPINEIGAGFLQATRSWIFFPTEVSFEISDDNQNFKPYGKVKNPHPFDNETQVTDDFTIKKSANARYIRVKAKNFGKLPEWHLGHGGDSYIFVDEVIVK